MAATMLICSRCGRLSPLGTRYCPNCGEAVDPMLVKELQALYFTLNDLDRRINDGQGADTITNLRDNYRERYLALRAAPAGANAGPVPVAPSAASNVPAWLGQRPPATPSAPIAVPTEPPVPAGPAFSWSAFIADQAIAIMAYLGGFLLLMATLSFEVGGLAGLGNPGKLAVVVAVYLVFGGLGWRLRTMDRLQTVGGAYLGVFALMTPLVALAVYLFALQGLGLSVQGMVCLAAAYATSIYLILARQTRFVTYGYLGWMALGITGQALLQWVLAPAGWWVAMLVGTALLLQFPRRLHWERALSEPATVVGGLATVIGLYGAESSFLNAWNGFVGTFGSVIDPAALAVASILLVPLLVLLGQTLRTSAPAVVVAATPDPVLPPIPPQPSSAFTDANRREIADVLDWLAAALAAQAAIAVAFWAKADQPTIAYLLTGLGLAEFAGIYATRRWRAGHNGLRFGLEGLALGLPLMGAYTMLLHANPNWPLVAALAGSALMALGITAQERLPWWLLASGGLASLAYNQLVTAILSANAPPNPTTAQIAQGTTLFITASFGLVAALWLLAMGLGLRTSARAYATPLYVVAVGNAFVVAFLSTLRHDLLGTTFVVGLLLAMAVMAGIAALREGQPGAMSIGAILGLWAVSQASGSVATLILVLGLIAIGLGLRQFRGIYWNIAWLAAAIFASPIILSRLSDMGTDAPHWRVGILLAFATIGYLVALQERSPWVTVATTIYGLFAALFIQSNPTFTPTLVLSFAAAAIGAAIRLRVNLRWALALYGLAAGASLLAVGRIMPQDGNHIEAWLLVFAAAAYVLAALEANPWSAAVPVLYVIGAVLTNPDAHALLPLALIFALLGIVAGRIGGLRWLLPPYIAAAVAAGATAVQGQHDPAFETLALAIFALVSYAIAAIESRPDLLAPTFVVGGLALASLGNWQAWAGWQMALTFVGLAWLYSAGAYLWRVLPWLRTSATPWWAVTISDPAQQAQWRDLRYVGLWAHRWAGLLVSVGAIVAALLAPNSFIIHASETQVVAGTLLALATMLVLRGRDRISIIPGAAAPRILWYVAGEFVALAATWEARWLGADNVQAYVLTPGSYQLLIGALLAVDERVGRPVALARFASVVGALLLLVPTLAQSFQNNPNWVYALVLAVEAIAIVGIGLGTRARVLVLAGSSFVGLAAIRGVILAFQSDAIALIIGVLAVLLMGGATWLSLRTRREAMTV